MAFSFNMPGNINLNNIASSLSTATARIGNVTAGISNGSLNLNFNNLVRDRMNQLGGGVSGYSGMINSLNQNPVKDTLSFPSNLDDEHYMIFNVIERQKPGKISFERKNPIQSIVLPVPSNLVAGYGVSYQNTNLGALGAMASGKINAQDVAGGIKGLAESVYAGVNKAVSELSTLIPGLDSNDGSGVSQDTINQAASVGTVGAAGLAGGATFGALGLVGGGGLSLSSVAQGMAHGAGVAINPHTAVLFDNVQFRQFQFEYKLIAKNQQESNTIKQICDTFRYHMHPSFAYDGLAFNYPEEFQMLFPEKIGHNLFNFGYCVLTSFNVNYNGENIPIFFEDTGAPVSINITMSFQETRVITKEALR